MYDLVIRNTSEVLTCSGSGAPEAMLGAIAGGTVGVSDGELVFLGTAGEVPSDAVGSKTQVIDARGGFVGPGLVDCHTHVVFAGDRGDEFEQRCQGVPYLEIAKAGGGILRTVRETRAASLESLVTLALPRLQSLLEQGVTTAEVKSGYGLSVDAELKLLRAVKALAGKQPISLVPTLLALHAVPPEFTADRPAYLKLVLDELLPKVVKEQLAVFCDAFVEESAFTAHEARLVMAAAKERGLVPRLHVDQLTAGGGGAELAAELGCATADHLEQTTPEGIAALKSAGTVPVLAPISTLFARVKPWAPGRALRDAGLPVALCTNSNPGSSNSESVALAMGLACLENGLTPAEAYLGFTRFGGEALRNPQLGRLEEGGPADLVVYRCSSYRTLAYHLAMNEVRQVIKGGKVVFSRDGTAPAPAPAA